MRQRREGALVTLRTRCAKMQAIVPSYEVRATAEARAGSGYGTSCGGKLPGVDFQVPAHTRVRWRDGRTAGWTSHRSNLHAYDRKDVGELACFPQSPTRFGCSSERIQLCVANDALEIIPSS